MSNKTNKQKSQDLKNNYTHWKKNSLESSGYFTIFSGFKDTNKLKNISGNALKLYIYLGITSNSMTGEVWHSNKTIAKYFGKSERTIRLWMQELESINLIKRFQLEFNEESHTFLQPYFNTEYQSYSEKYTYHYRLKDSKYRRSIDLNNYRSLITKAIQSSISNSYINVYKDFFVISSFKPIDSKLLRSVNKFIKKSAPELESFSSVSKYTNRDGSISYHKSLFERVRK